MSRYDKLHDFMFRQAGRSETVFDWSAVIAHLRRKTNSTITLANGQLLDMRQACLYAFHRFPELNNKFLFMSMLASAVTSQERFDLDGEMLNRLGMYKKLLTWAYNNDRDKARLLYETGIRMAVDDTIYVNRKRMNATEILQEAIFQNDQNEQMDALILPQLACRMRPFRDKVNLPDVPGTLDTIEVYQRAYDINRELPLTLVGMAISSDRIVRLGLTSIDLLKMALEKSPKKFTTDVPKEPSGIDYDTLPVGGDDEWRGFVGAVRSNDLRAFALSALARREQGEVEEFARREQGEEVEESAQKRKRRGTASH